MNTYLKGMSNDGAMVDVLESDEHTINCPQLSSPEPEDGDLLYADNATSVLRSVNWSFIERDRSYGRLCSPFDVKSPSGLTASGRLMSGVYIVQSAGHSHERRLSRVCLSSSTLV